MIRWNSALLILLFTTTAFAYDSSKNPVGGKSSSTYSTPIPTKTETKAKKKEINLWQKIKTLYPSEKQVDKTSKEDFIYKSGSSDGNICSFLSQPIIDFESEPLADCPFCSFDPAEGNVGDSTQKRIAKFKEEPVSSQGRELVDPDNEARIIAIPPTVDLAKASSSSHYALLAVQGIGQSSFSIHLPEAIPATVKLKLRLARVYVPASPGSRINIHAELSLNGATQELFQQDCNQIYSYTDFQDSIPISGGSLPVIEICDYAAPQVFNIPEGLRDLQITLSNHAILEDWVNHITFYPSAYLSIDDIEFEGVATAPVALRYAADKVILFPPSDPCNLNDNVSTWQIFRKYRDQDPIPTRAVYAVSKRELEAGFVDDHFDITANPSYAVRPIRAGQTSQRSDFSKTSWPNIRPVVTMDHSPLQNTPTHITAEWIEKSVSTKTRTAQSANNRIGLSPLDVTATRLTEIATMLRNSQLWRSDANSLVVFAPNPGQGTPGSFLPNPTLNLSGNNNDAFLSLNNFDLIDNAGQLITSQAFWLVGGDLAKKPLTDPQRQRVIAELELLQPPVDLNDCIFEGNQFQCPAPEQGNSPAVKITFPTLQPSLMTALKNFYFDSTQNEGLLLSQPWKRFADDRADDIWQNISKNMTNLASLPNNGPALNPYALGFATYDASALVIHDLLPGNNLFKTGSSLLTDWWPAIEQLTYRRLIRAFTINRRENDVTDVVRAYASLIGDLQFAYYADFGLTHQVTFDSVSQYEDLMVQQLKNLFLSRYILINGQAYTQCPTMDDFENTQTSEWADNIHSDKEKIADYLRALNEYYTFLNQPENAEKKSQFLDDFGLVLNNLQALFAQGKIRFQEGLGPATAAAYNPASNEVLLDGLHKDKFYNVMEASLFHEGVHALHYKTYFQTAPVPSHSHTNINENIKILLQYLQMKGRLRAFTEMRAYWDERVILNRYCMGRTSEDRQTATLEDDVLSHGVYREALANERLLKPKDCTTATCLMLVGDPELQSSDMPWTPVGKNSPWE